jgi:hypothetical protein
MKHAFWAILATAIMATGGVSAAAQNRDGAVIRNSGSTNFPGYTIRVWSDGSATVEQTHHLREAASAPTSGTLPSTLVQKFFEDARAARNQHAIGRACMKSASFGTTTVVQWHGWTSPDLECPGDGLVVALASDAHEIAAALKSGAPGSRRPLLPNEPRRAPVESAPTQASPMPEQSPSIS